MEELDFPKYNEAKANAQFKSIRNRLRTHNAEKIVLRCIGHLNSQSLDKKGYIPPWLLFLLIKWTIMHGDKSSFDKKPLDIRNFTYLVNMLRDDLWAIIRGPIDYEDLSLFFRNVAYQQFWLQEKHLLGNKIGRQVKIFSKLPTNHTFKIQFYSLTKVQLNNFLELLFITLYGFLETGYYYLPESYFFHFRKYYPNDELNNFLSLISPDWENLKNFLENQKGRSVSYEFHEQTPLKRFPLLCIDKYYYSYSLDLLLHSASNLVYDILRDQNTESFMQEFGRMFENYVGEILSQLSCEVIPERDLQRSLGYDQKIIDFLLLESNANIFIDAKGVELNIMGMLSHQVNTVVGKVKTSVLKGIEQFFSTLYQIKRSGYIDINSKKNYFLIVTYKDLYLGMGKNFTDGIGANQFKKLQGSYPDCASLISDNLFLVSIDDFDLMIEMAKQKGWNLSDILDNIKSMYNNPESRKFIFHDYLIAIDRNVKKIGHLKTEYDYLVNNCLKKLQNYNLEHSYNTVK